MFESEIYSWLSCLVLCSCLQMKKHKVWNFLILAFLNFDVHRMLIPLSNFTICNTN